MKLRILGNAIRLRLTQPEVAAFGEHGRVVEHIRFRPGEYMTYALEASDVVDHLAARYEDERITVRVPSAWVAGWVETDAVSLEGTQPIEGEAALEILIEKDFKCLHGPESRIDADAFPNPLANEQEMP
jgi:hypothetical protein